MRHQRRADCRTAWIESVAGRHGDDHRVVARHAVGDPRVLSGAAVEDQIGRATRSGARDRDAAARDDGSRVGVVEPALRIGELKEVVLRAGGASDDDGDGTVVVAVLVVGVDQRGVRRGFNDDVVAVGIPCEVIFAIRIGHERCQQHVVDRIKDIGAGGIGVEPDVEARQRLVVVEEAAVALAVEAHLAGDVLERGHLVALDTTGGRGACDSHDGGGIHALGLGVPRSHHGGEIRITGGDLGGGGTRRHGERPVAACIGGNGVHGPVGIRDHDIDIGQVGLARVLGAVAVAVHVQMTGEGGRDVVAVPAG